MMKGELSYCTALYSMLDYIITVVFFHEAGSVCRFDASKSCT